MTSCFPHLLSFFSSPPHIFLCLLYERPYLVVRGARCCHEICFFHRNNWTRRSSLSFWMLSFGFSERSRKKSSDGRRRHRTSSITGLYCKRAPHQPIALSVSLSLALAGYIASIYIDDHFSLLVSSYWSYLILFFLSLFLSC